MLTHILLALYLAVSIALLIYGVNCYVMLWLFQRSFQKNRAASQALLASFGDPMKRSGDLPAVTTQLPLYNEYNVAQRIIEAAARMTYPAGKHEIQVLDDSTDDTRMLVERTVQRLQHQGVRIHILRRTTREGYKAGALAHGMTRAGGDLIAIFDSDFVPPADFLLKTVPFFMTDPGIGLVQTRWGHLNANHSLLTKVQSIGIDGHFMVEQSARSYNGLMMNFNGTAGIWRKTAITEAGGWQSDTLTEDMDLSYRAQLAGWQSHYLPDVVVPAEIPQDASAFKSQQFRWAKGSIQTAMKVLPRILRADLPLFTKIQAFFHLTHYAIHPLMMTVAILALPVLCTVEIQFGPLLFTLLALVLLGAMMGPNVMYVVSQRTVYPDWKSRVCFLPVLMCVGVGIALSNTRAVLEAVFGVRSGFVRTPKSGDREMKSYRIRMPVLALLEIGLGAYCMLSLHVYFARGKYLIGPFLMAYAAGFSFIGTLSLLQFLRRSSGSFAHAEASGNKRPETTA